MTFLSKTRHTFKETTVTKVFQDKVTGEWFLMLEGLRNSFFVGTEKPDANVGDRARLIIETWKHDEPGGT